MTLLVPHTDPMHLMLVLHPFLNIMELNFGGVGVLVICIFIVCACYGCEHMFYHAYSYHYMPMGAYQHYRNPPQTKRLLHASRRKTNAAKYKTKAIDDTDTEVEKIIGVLKLAK